MFILLITLIEFIVLFILFRMILKQNETIDSLKEAIKFDESLIDELDYRLKSLDSQTN